MNSRYWPVVPPYNSGLLKVSGLHSIWYGLYGDPGGIPVFFLHGGPGSATIDFETRWFDPKKYHVVMHHQRGCGKSVPLNETKENTTWDLVEDINKLRAHLNVKVPMIIFAGSWGTTLGLLYAEKYPDNVYKMVLRGTWLAEYKNQEAFYAKDGMGRLKPKEWEHFNHSVPPGSGRMSERLDKVYREGTPEQIKKCARAQMEYEYSFFDQSKEEFEKSLSNYEACFTEIRLATHYLANRVFIEDGQIVKNVDRISHIPTIFVNGEKDPLCPPEGARRLHVRMPNSEHVIVKASGHLSSDEGISLALLEAMERI